MSSLSFKKKAGYAMVDVVSNIVMKTISSLIFTIMLLFVAVACKAQMDYQNPSLTINQRVDDLLGKMTMEEKLAQLQFSSDTNYIGTNGIGNLGFLDLNLTAGEGAKEYNQIQKYLLTKTRLGIPGLRSGEGLFTYMGLGSVCFPQPLAMAASWDTAVVGMAASNIGTELKSRGIQHVYAPNINIARDPRWGRTSETYGEDPFLTGMMGVAYVRAVEQQQVMSCPKHFAANMGLNGRFGAPIHFSERLFNEIYFPAFKACIQEGGAKSIMMAYNTIDGIPCAANKWLMTDVLRKQWDFDGIVLSDGDGLGIAYSAYGISNDSTEFAARAMNNGCDVSLSFWDNFYRKPLTNAVQKGLVSEARINEAVKRVLTQKFRLGLFEHPFADPKKADSLKDNAQHRKNALLAAQKSAVLLQNNKSTLPFLKSVKKIAVVGPLANWLLINHYGGNSDHRITVYDGIKNLLPNADVTLSRGVELKGFYYPAISPGCFPGGLKAAYFNNVELKGNPVFTRTDKNIDFEWGWKAIGALPKDFFSVRWTGKLVAPQTGETSIGLTNDDGMRLFIDGKLIVDNWGNGARRMAESKYYFQKGKSYNIKVEYFDGLFNATAHLGWGFGKDELFQQAINTVKKADVAVLVCGMFEDENGDRANLDLDEQQEKLIKEIAKLNKPFVVILQSGGVITMRNWVDKAPAILQTWFPGEEGGTAIAQMLFGDVNPGGKLPVTIPRATGQIPLNYNQRPTKPDTKVFEYGITPQFVFGHGLSYTTFEYSNLRIANPEFKENETVEVSVDITNTGKVAGDEVVQLYTHDIVATISPYEKELKGFQRIHLEKGQKKTIQFKLKASQLEMWNENMERVLEPGDFKVMIGSSSDDIRLTSTIHAIKSVN